MNARMALGGFALVAAVTLAGCSPVAETVTQSLDSASAATASVSTVLQQLEDGRALPPFADTVIGDALTELDAASRDLSETGPVGDPADRDAALDAVRAGTDAVLTAREAVASHGDLDDDIDAVESATERLHALSGGPS